MNILNEISSSDSLKAAWKRILSKNKQTAGIDKVTLNEFSINLKKNLKKISIELQSNKYIFQTVIVKDIPKKKGSTDTREIGLYAIRDKIVLKAIQISFEKERRNKGKYLFPGIFNKISIGFITRDQKEAVGMKKFVKEIKGLYKAGFGHTYTLDIEKFFSKLDTNDLKAIIKKALKQDNSIDFLIDQFLKPEVIKLDRYGNETSVTSHSGVTQGSILSPLLSNIYMMKFDNEVESKSYKVFRFADDVLLLAQSKKKANLALADLRAILLKYSKLEFYPVGKEKGPKYKFLEAEKAEYLGLDIILRPGGMLFLLPSKKSIQNQMEKIRKILSHENEISIAHKLIKVNNSIVGWINYYRNGCESPKKELSLIVMEIKNKYERLVNELLTRYHLINSYLDSNKLFMLGVMSPKIVLVNSNKTLIKKKSN